MWQKRELKFMADLPSLLLVDDDPLITEPLAFILKDSFSATIVETCEEARRFLHKSPILPNLALIDLGLPPTPHSPKEGFNLVLGLSFKLDFISARSLHSGIQHPETLPTGSGNWSFDPSR